MKSFWSVLTALMILFPSLVVAEDELTVAFYPLGELAHPPQKSRSPESNLDSAPAARPIQGGGGTGFFSIPVVAQMPIPSEAADQFEATRLQYSNDVHGALVDLIIANVDADSWEENGGEGTITAVNDTLVVRQNAENHKATSEFLKNLHLNTIGGQELKIELWWLPLDDAGRQRLQQILEQDDAVAKLSELSESIGGYHGQLNTRNRVLGNLSSGHQTPLITGRIPVVGNGAIGIQPLVSQVHIGLTAQVHPRIQETWEGNGIQLSLQTDITEMTERTHCETTGGDIDRFQLGHSALSANILCRPSTLNIVGSLSAIGSVSEDSPKMKELTVVVRVSK